MAYPFPEDDEMELEEQLHGIDREMGMMADQRNHVVQQIKKRALDPTTAKIAELAEVAGYNRGMREGADKRIKFLEIRIEARDARLENLSDYWDWKKRAEAAELKLSRKRKR